MSKHKSPKRNQMRGHLAYLAARLMADGGITDFAQAKLKAARQAGVPDTHSLPDNKEIEEALRSYQNLYQQSHSDTLTALRRKAIELMHMLEEFTPYLVGSVLTGTAGQYSDINLHVYADSPKDVEMFLLNKNIPYQSGMRRTHLGDRHLEVPTLTIESNGFNATLSLFHTDDMRVAQKYKADGRPIERARIAQVEALLDPDRNTTFVTPLI